jgi:hypothetical protein
MNINLEELKNDRQRNSEERMKFIEFWANYVKTHSDKEWSKQQNVLIDSQIEHAHNLVKKKK